MEVFCADFSGNVVLASLQEANSFILCVPGQVAAETTAVEKDQGAGVSAVGPAESFVGQLGVDESAAEISLPQEAKEARSAEGTQEGSSAAEAASSRREAAGPTGMDPIGGRGRRRGRGAFRDVDDEGPGGVSASAVVMRRCMLHQQPRRRLFLFHGSSWRGSGFHTQGRLLPSCVGGGVHEGFPCRSMLR